VLGLASLWLLYELDPKFLRRRSRQDPRVPKDPVKPTTGDLSIPGGKIRGFSITHSVDLGAAAVSIGPALLLDTKPPYRVNTIIGVIMDGDDKTQTGHP
jgi:hypothetical protein